MNKNIRWLWNIDTGWWWCWLICAVILFGLAAVSIALVLAVDGFIIIPGIIPFLTGLLYLRFAWRSWRRRCRKIAQEVLDRMNGKDGCEQYGIFNNTFKSRIK